MRLAAIALGFALSSSAAAARDSVPAELARRMDQLSRSLTATGAGWSEYESILHPDYARWTVGGAYQDRSTFLADLKEWWEFGMRVKSREVEQVAADVAGGVAVIRMTTSETFVGPEGDAGGFNGHVVNVWVKDRGEWLLLSADIVEAP